MIGEGEAGKARTRGTALLAFGFLCAKATLAYAIGSTNRAENGIKTTKRRKILICKRDALFVCHLFEDKLPLGS